MVVPADKSRPADNSRAFNGKVLTMGSRSYIY